VTRTTTTTNEETSAYPVHGREMMCPLLKPVAVLSVVLLARGQSHGNGKDDDGEKRKKKASTPKVRLRQSRKRAQDRKQDKR
jgi:hypothetical protein